MKTEQNSFEALYAIVRRLRAPEGCPWDRKQTPDSMRPSLIEEAYECIEAIDDRDDAHVCEELGDLFLILTMIGRIYEEQGRFTFGDLFTEICAKLVRRHPHVFGDEVVDDADEVVEVWNRIKRDKEGRGRQPMSGQIPKSLPPLERAEEIQKKAAKAGFEWRHTDDVWKKVHEEIEELKTAETAEAREEEFGDVLFSLVNLARFMKVSPFLALNGCNNKFLRRFAHVEKRMAETGQEMSQANLEVMDAFWEEAKRQESVD